MTAPSERLRGLSRDRRARECARLQHPADADRQTRVLHQSLARLGQWIEDLTGVVDDLETEIAEIVEDLAPGLGR